MEFVYFLLDLWFQLLNSLRSLYFVIQNVPHIFSASLVWSLHYFMPSPHCCKSCTMWLHRSCWQGHPWKGGHLNCITCCSKTFMYPTQILKSLSHSITDGGLLTSSLQQSGWAFSSTQRTRHPWFAQIIWSVEIFHFQSTSDELGPREVIVGVDYALHSNFPL